MYVYQFLVLYVLATSVGLVYVHVHFTDGQFSRVQAALAFFCALNTLICCWEISLGKQISLIKSDLDKLKATYKDKDRIRACTRFFMLPVGMSDLFSSRFWSAVWSTYSLYDPSYSNQESYGFFIDVGNGWSTLLPSIIIIVGMTLQDRLMSARSLGMLMLVKFYQEFYGTCIYLLSYIFNKRYKGTSAFEVIMFVLVSNGLWFVFPLLGMVVAYQFIQTDSFDALLL